MDRFLAAVRVMGRGLAGRRFKGSEVRGVGRLWVTGSLRAGEKLMH